MTNTQWTELQQTWTAVNCSFSTFETSPFLSVTSCSCCDCCDSLMALVPVLSFLSLLKWPYLTKPTFQPPPLTWHKAGTDTLWWSFYSQTSLQLYVNTRVQTSVHGILIFVLVVNLHWQFCSACSDHPLHLIFIQAELEVPSGQSAHLWKEGLSLRQLPAKGGRKVSNESWLWDGILEFTVTFLYAIYVFTCFLDGWW